MINYDVFIPMRVREDKELSALEKLLYGDLVSYINCNFDDNYKPITYCNEHDKYFADVYNVSENEIVKALTNLRDKSYINVIFTKTHPNIPAERRIFLAIGTYKE